MTSPQFASTSCYGKKSMNLLKQPYRKKLKQLNTRKQNPMIAVPLILTMNIFLVLASRHIKGILSVNSSIVFLDILVLMAVITLNQLYFHYNIRLFPKGDPLKDWGLYVPALLYFGIAIMAITQWKGDFLAGFQLSVPVALAEETTFRGLILFILLEQLKANKTNLHAIVWGNGLIFGSMHFLNLDSQALLPTLAQVAQAGALGMLAAAMVIRSGSLLPGVLFHISNNFVSGYLAPKDSGSVASFSWAFLPYVIVCVLLTYVYLRKSKTRALPIFDDLHQKTDQKTVYLVMMGFLAISLVVLFIPSIREFAEFDLIRIGGASTSLFILGA